MHTTAHRWQGNGQTPPASLPRDELQFEPISCPLLDHGQGRGDQRPSAWIGKNQQGEIVTAGCHSTACDDAEVRRALDIQPARTELRAAMREAAQASQEKRRVRILPEAVRQALAEYSSAEPATAQNPYLKFKGVQPHPNLRAVGGTLLVPAFNSEGQLVSVMRIFSPGVMKKGKRSAVRFRKLWPKGTRKSGLLCHLDASDEKIILAEGIATALSIGEVTGCTSVCTFGDGNLTAAAKLARELHPEAEIIVAADHDAGIKAAREAARAVGGLVAMPKTPGFDFNDLHQKFGLRAVRARLLKADTPEPSDDEQLEHLATLGPLEYARARKATARAMDIPVGALDEAVRDLRKAGKVADAQGTPVVFQDAVPAAEPQDGALLLTDLSAAVRRCVVLPKHADTAIALWIIFSHIFHIFGIAPLLAILSPEMRCGKTTLMCLLLRLCARALPSSNITPAVLFRAIEKFRPTLLIDEADSFLKMRDELRGVLNSGHDRELAFVMRSVGDDHEPAAFNTFGPKAVAMIGKLPPTLADRSVTIHLRRKLPAERVRSMRTERAKAELLELRSRIARFAADHADDIGHSAVIVPSKLNDRQRDNWRPLLAIAQLAGKAWLGRAREAAVAFSGKDDDNDSVRVLLLRDLHLILESEPHPVSSARVLTALHSTADRPWANSGMASR